MTKQELIELILEYPDDFEIEFDLGEDDKGKDLGQVSIFGVSEEGGVIYLEGFESDDEVDSGEIIDAEYTEVK